VSEGRLRDDRDAASAIARKLVRKGADLRFLEGEAHTWLTTLPGTDPCGTASRTLTPPWRPLRWRPGAGCGLTRAGSVRGEARCKKPRGATGALPSGTRSSPSSRWAARSGSSP
jgi:hypothetical protein